MSETEPTSTGTGCATAPPPQRDGDGTGGRGGSSRDRSGLPGRLRNRIASWAGRRALSRIRRKGIDASTLALVPESVLMHLRRDGLDPVPDVPQQRTPEGGGRGAKAAVLAKAGKLAGRPAGAKAARGAGAAAAGAKHSGTERSANSPSGAAGSGSGAGAAGASGGSSAPSAADVSDAVASAADASGSSAPMSKVHLPFGHNAWLVTGYDEVRQVLAVPDAFSNDLSTMTGAPASVKDQNPGGLGFADPPDHTRLRRILTPEFTVRRLRRLTPLIESIVDDQLDGMEKAAAAGGTVDLVDAFAWPIPSLTICELLGVPAKDRDKFQRLSTERFDMVGGVDAAFGTMSASLTYLEEIVAEQRRSPGDGLLGMIARTHGDDVSDEELVGLADGVLTGGLETSASMLALGSLVLLRNPEAFRRMRDDEDAVDDLVEELLRYLTVVQIAFPRIALRDIEIGGQQVESGDIMLCSLLRANRSSGLVPGAGEFDHQRGKLPHLAFGHGIHRCVGAELARMELRTAYPALLRRFPDMRLAVDPDSLSFRELSIVYGMDSLPVTLR